jgi:hypothetical protein
VKAFKEKAALWRLYSRLFWITGLDWVTVQWILKIMQDYQYRIDRMAKEAEIWQWLVNGFRKIFGLQICKTSQDAADEVRQDDYP